MQTVIQCARNADNVVPLNDNYSEWINTFEEPIHLRQGSEIRVNYAFLATQAATDVISITDDNNTATVDCYFYSYALAEGVDPALVDLVPAFITEGSGNSVGKAPYTKTTTIAIENGNYTVDQLALLINNELVAPTPTVNSFPTGNFISTNSPVFQMFSSENFGLGQMSDNGYDVCGGTIATDNPNGWYGIIGNVPMQNIGAPQLLFTYNKEGNSRFAFSFLHQPQTGSNGNPAVDVQWEADRPYAVTQLGGTVLRLSGQLWSDLGFDTTQNYHTDNVQSTAYQTYRGAAPWYNPATQTRLLYESDSALAQAQSEPTLFSAPFWLIKSDLISEANFYNENGKVSNIGFVSKNLAEGGYVYSYENSYTIQLKEDKTIKSIKTSIVDPITQRPAVNLTTRNSYIIYEVNEPPLPESVDALREPESGGTEK